MNNISLSDRDYNALEDAFNAPEEVDLLELGKLKFCNEEGNVLRLGDIILIALMAKLFNLDDGMIVYNSETGESYGFSAIKLLKNDVVTFIHDELYVDDSNRYKGLQFVHGYIRGVVEITKPSDPFYNKFITHREVEFYIGTHKELNKSKFVFEDNLSSINCKYSTNLSKEFFDGADSETDTFVMGSPMYKHKRQTNHRGELVETWFDKVQPGVVPEWVEEYRKQNKLND